MQALTLLAIANFVADSIADTVHYGQLLLQAAVAVQIKKFSLSVR
jgi:hypothetical protein